MIALVRVKSIGLSSPFLVIVSLILEPDLPRIFLTASSKVIFAVGSPLINAITSPPLIPACHAGVSSIAHITVNKSFFIVIVIPKPPKEPLVLC